MHATRRLATAALACTMTVVAACSTAPPPPPVMERPAVFTPLGLGAAYLSGDVIGSKRTRAARLRAAGIRPLDSASAAKIS